MRDLRVSSGRLRTNGFWDTGPEGNIPQTSAHPEIPPIPVRPEVVEGRTPHRHEPPFLQSNVHNMFRSSRFEVSHGA